MNTYSLSNKMCAKLFASLKGVVIGSIVTDNASQTRFAPSPLQVSSQFLIHSPSPQPYEPKRAMLLPFNALSHSLKTGSNSLSSRTSAPIAGQPNAMPSKSTTDEESKSFTFARVLLRLPTLHPRQRLPPSALCYLYRSRILLLLYSYYILTFQFLYLITL